MRVLAIGEDGCPHIHMLLSERGADLVVATARKVSKRALRISNDHADDVPGLLGYFYDVNFFETFRRIDRPKLLRLLSGSRGLSYGYPNKRAWKALLAQLSRERSPAEGSAT